ncbi:MAG: tRNA (adenosine(37)-N6)-dimethylallyltransferase MiaA [Bacilli bacterium]
MVIVIVGPTGVGKTKLSIELAHKYNGEVINADSTQVYKCLDIATAKVTDAEKEGVVHHLIDIKDVNEDYTVFDFQRDCRSCITDILSRGKTPIIVGGTGLYVKAALYDYKFDVDDNHFDYSDYSNDDLYERLISIDPDTSIHKNNRKRVERFLSYYDSTGKLLSDKEKSSKLLYDSVFIGLTTDREILYDRINKRVDIMISNGLLDEARRIYDSGVRSKAVMTPIGYKELFDYFSGETDLDSCVNLIKQRSRNYAKRQYTWFNNQMDINWFDVDFNNFSNTVLEVSNFIDCK